MVGKDIEKLDNGKQRALETIGDKFRIGDTVVELQRLMREVTKNEVTPETVNAACNCVNNLNLTLRTAIQAAKYLSEI